MRNQLKRPMSLLLTIALLVGLVGEIPAQAAQTAAAESGATEKLSVSAPAILSAVTGLSELAINGAALVLTDGAESSYVMEVPGGNTTITATAKDAAAKVELFLDNVPCTDTVNLTKHLSKLTVKVTSGDGSNVCVYNVDLIIPTPGSLDIASFQTRNAALSPTFDQNVLAYTASSEDSALSLDVKMVENGATIRAQSDGMAQPVSATGTLSAKIPLMNGITNVRVTVISADKTKTKTYTIQVTRSGYVLRYNQPATNWMKEALPIGNGYIGGMVFGGIQKDIIQFNEKTLWTGGPGHSGYNYGNNEVFSSLQPLRDRLKNGASIGDNQSDVIGTLRPLYGNQNGYGCYQNFGQLEFDFGSSLGTTENYNRYLDLSTATAGVGFDANGAHYTREYFTSYPDNVMVMRFAASKPGALNFSTKMVSAQGGTSVATADGTITLAGAVSDNHLRYESMLKVIPTGGTLSNTGDAVAVANADSVLVIMTAGTDYKNEYPNYRTGVDPHEAVNQRIANAEAKGYDALRKTQLNDYQEIFSRVNLELGQANTRTPTDQLLQNYPSASADQKRQLEVLLFQFGRYLLLSSSREGTIPANLQGIWNNSNDSTWSGDYHFNVNIEMNYWPAYVTNMAETAIPLVDYVDSLREPGRNTAKAVFGIETTPEKPRNGWMVTTMNNPFGCTAVGTGPYGWSPASNAWISDNLWEYYEFTGDQDYLRSTIYPVIREAAVFWTQALVEDGNRLVSSPSFSPEHGPVTAGNAFDQQLIAQLYKDVIAASTELGVDNELRATLEGQLAKLEPLTINPQSGMIKEWYYEDQPGFKTGFIENKHRHVSQLVGLYPGKLLTPDMTEYVSAAKATLLDRGDGGTGWSRAHKMTMWARLLDGDHALTMLSSQLARAWNTGIDYNGNGGGTYDNLFCAHPPLQLDGNEGATAGIAEMLLQSHTGAIAPLAALPGAWSDGSYTGLVARGDFETDAAWANGRLQSFTVRSGEGNDCVLSYANIAGAAVTCNGEPIAYDSVDNDTISFATQKGAEYVITQIPGAGLSAPTNIVANRTNTGSVTLSWAAAENAASYHIYRSVGGGKFEKLVAFATGTSFTDATAVQSDSEMLYSYRISAVDASGGEGPLSAAVLEQWGDQNRITSITLSSANGVTSLNDSAERVQLLTAVLPATGTNQQLKWSVAVDGTQATPVTVDVSQSGLVLATGTPGTETVVVTAAAQDGSGVTGTITLTTNIPEISKGNLLSGKAFTVTGAAIYEGGTSGYGLDKLTDGNLGTRLALNESTEANLTATLSTPQKPGLLRIYDYKGRTTKMDVAVVYSGETGWTKVVADRTDRKEIDAEKFLWEIPLSLTGPIEQLRVTIKNAGTGPIGNREMSIWEIESYAGTEVVMPPVNLFRGASAKATTDAAGTHNAATHGGYDAGKLTDGINADPSRLALNGEKSVYLTVTLTAAQKISLLKLYDYDLRSTAVEDVAVKFSSADANWTEIPNAVVSKQVVNEANHWSVALPEMNAVQQLRIKTTGDKELSFFELEGYHPQSAPAKKALLAALEKAALCKESDFAGNPDGWTAFGAARSAALACANNPEATKAEMNAATDALTSAIGNIDITPKLARIALILPGANMARSSQMQAKVLAYYDRGQPAYVTGGVTYAADPTSVAAVSASGLVTANEVGTATITATFGGQTSSASVTVSQNQSGALTVACIGGGKVSRSAEGPYAIGDKVTLTAVPESGYVFTHWKVGGKVVGTEATYVATAGINSRVEALFESNGTKYTVTAENSLDNGKIETAATTAAAGERITVTVTPDAGFRLKPGSLQAVYTAGDVQKQIVLVNNAFTMPGYPVSITAVFEPAPLGSYTATLTEGNNYRIEAQAGSSNPIAEGGSFSFTVTPDAAYTQSALVVKANGTILSPSGGVYTISGISANQIVTVEGLTRNTYTVTFHADGHEDSVLQVAHGATLTSAKYPQVPAKAGYTGVWSVTSDLVNITQNQLVNAIYAAEQYTVTLNANGGVALNPGTVTVTYAQPYTGLPTPTYADSTKIFDGWYTAATDGTRITAETTVSVAADHTLYAHWRDVGVSARPDTTITGMPDRVVLTAKTAIDLTAPTAPDGSVYTYVWEHSLDNGATWQVLDGTSATYTIAESVITLDNTGRQYHCVVTNREGEKIATTATSEAVTLNVELGKKDAPNDLVGNAPSSLGGTGSITGLHANEKYERRQESETKYTDVTLGATEIKGLRTGNYYVRFAKTNETMASDDQLVIVPAYGADDVRVTGVTLDRKYLEISADQQLPTSVQLVATVAPAGATNQSVTWSSSDSSVATVNATGLVTLVKRETATITVRTADGSFTDTCTVTYAEPHSSSSNTIITISKNADGSTTITVTDKTTDTVTVTTTYPDGAKTVVQTKKDGTVSTTATGKDGVKVETVTTPAGATTAKITLPKNVQSTKVTIPARNLKPGTVAVIVHADGTQEIINTSVVTMDGMKFLTDSSVVIKLIDNTKHFTDVPADNWAAGAIEFAASRELFNGTGKDAFAPTADMSRAMLVTVLARLDGRNTTAGETWYTEAVDWAKNLGISDGSDLDATISREQLAVMLYRYAKAEKTQQDLKNFTDATSVSAWAADAMSWSVDSGIINGKDGKLDPQGEATRAEVAAMLQRFAEWTVK